MRIRFVLSFLILWALLGCGRTLASDLALVGAKIYLSPTEQPIERGSILIREGRITAVGPSSAVKIPRGTPTIDCTGLTITAGFWNSHVHLILPGLLHAEKLPSQQLTSQLEQMLTRWGFTSVFDIASVLENTNIIRRRIESGEVRGPRIFTTGEPFWIRTPIYIGEFLVTNHIAMPEIESKTQAAGQVRQQIHDGVDGIKIFANSVQRDDILTMPLRVAQAIVAEAHYAHKAVFAHVSNDEGNEVAIQSGVDVLAHTTPSGSVWNESFVKRLNAAHMALTPTLTLFDVEGKKAGTSPDVAEKWSNKAIQQLKAFSQSGGQVLFGTDVGYIDQFDTTEEFMSMSRAGLSFRQILASLTTNPAQRFGSASHLGRIARGMDADLTILTADPAQDSAVFSKVRYTIVGGKVIYSQR
ncbi:MAG: amidohydrolase family protein [Candidatus Acidiferrum sp.]